MTSNWRLALIPVVCLTVTACKVGGGDKAPTGQVVATVDGQEITLRDLKAEMAGVNLPDPNAMKAAEQQALQQMVQRKILAQEAVVQKIDKTPDFALQKERLTESLLAQSLQNKLVAQVPKPTKEEADRFITDHPDIFSQRKVFVVDQIQMARPRDPAVIKGLQPLKTLEQIGAYLTAQKIPFKRDSGNLDAVGLDPRLVDAIVKLPAGEVFVVPAGQALLINQVRDTKIVPLAGDQASKYATQVLTKQHTQDTVSRQFKAMIQKAMPKVKFNSAYQPPKALPGATPVPLPPPPPAR